jgi:hypothetical protein
MKKIIPAILCVAALVGFTALFSRASDPPKKKDESKPAEESKSAVAKFMRAKLHNSQDVLEGLTTEDYEKIKAGAQRMIIMAKAAEWNSYGGEVYARDTAIFVDSAQELVNHAKGKNLDGATLSYVQLTMNCMACHKHLKGVKVATGDRHIFPPSR